MPERIELKKLIILIILIFFIAQIEIVLEFYTKEKQWNWDIGEGHFTEEFTLCWVLKDGCRIWLVVAAGRVRKTKAMLERYGESFR